MSSSFNWLTASFSWIRRGRKAHFQPKAPRFRPVIENLEGRLNPAPVASLPQLLDMPHSLVVLSPDIASLVPVAEYAGARVVTLDPTRDAISQISASLAGQSSVTSLRVIGHGQPGSVSLAGQTINLATLQARSVEVAGWASHLTPDADILLYGCSVASTAGGRAFVNTLATLTGADVAASTDATGAGGNLTLEYTAGVVTDHLKASSQAWTKSGLQLPSEGDYNYDTNPDGTSVTITGYTGPGGAVTIPGTLGGLPVKAIGKSAFEGITNLTSLTIPASVTSIGERTFASCTSLTGVTISEGVTSIGKDAFGWCSSLTSVTIPASATSIGVGAFYSCSSLTSVTILSGVTTIEAWSFASCSSLTSFTIPSSVTSIGYSAFAECTSLTSVTIPEGVTSIEGYVFRDCTSLTGMTIPASVTSIGERTFASCTSLTGVTIPEGVTSIGKDAFVWCSSLTSVTIPASVTSIGVGAFYSCSSLTSVAILDSFFSAGVTTIEAWSFASCSSLTSFTIPSSVTSIKDEAFSNCTSLACINTLGNAPTLGGSNVFYQVPATLYYTSGTTGWTNPWGGLPTVEMTEGGYQFSINPGGTSVTITGYTGPGGAINIPDTLAGLPVTAIGYYAFYYSSSLTSVTILPGVTTIEPWAFASCSSLTSFTIPSSVTSIGYSAFAECTSLTSLTIPEGVTSIEDNVFRDCTSLTGLTIPASVTSIGDSAFFNCGRLTGVTIPSSVTSIGPLAFAGCTSLTGVTIPEGVTSIGKGAFDSCSSLTSVTIPASVNFIGSGAFSRCSSLTSVTILSGVTTIEDLAFASCSSLTSFTIPSSVNSIGDYAFSYCSSLTSLTIPESVNSIGEYAFLLCSSLTSLTIPSSVTSIGEFAFSSCRSLTAIEVDGTNNDFSSRDGILFNKLQTILIQYPAGIAGTYTIPSSVLSIGGGAFYSCVGLTSVTIPESVNSIEERAFEYCSSLTSVTIPESITSIGTGVFAYCSGLTSVTIPESVTSIGVAAFYSCSSLTSFTIPSSVNSIGDYAFSYCSSLTNITIPESVTSIGIWVFVDCSSLTAIEVAVANNNFSSVDGVLFNKAQTTLIQCPAGKAGTYTIPGSVTSIGEGALASCSSLTSVAIPSSVTSIGDSAFMGCTGLTRINTLGNAPALGNDVFANVPATLYYTSGTTGWTNPWGGLPTVEMTEGGYQFSINPDGTSVTVTGYTGPGGAINIPATLTGLPVTRIGGSAFQENSSLTSVTIPEGVTFIGEWAFAGCRSLTSVTIPGSVTLIGEGAFASCQSLTSVTIPKGVTAIGDSAFAECSSLTSLTLPESLTSIGIAAFNSCSSLTSLTIPEGVTSIGTYAFGYCNSLTAIEVDVANNDFSSVDGILFNKAQTTLIQCPEGKAGSVIIPSSVTSIGTYAFASCKSLTSVTIPSTVTSIGNSAFDSCKSLTSLTIPASVTSIGEWAFASCSSLTAIEVDVANNDFSSVDGVLFNTAQTTLIQCPAGKAGTYTIPGSVTSIGKSAFASCQSLTSVTIPSSVTSIGDAAFYFCTGMTSLTILPGVTTIGDYAFYLCGSLTSMTIPASVTSIGIWVFVDCSSLTAIEVDGANKDFISVDGVLFNKAQTNLIQFPAGKAGTCTISGSVTSIGYGAFASCISLTSVTMSSSVTSIGDGAFAGCTGLTRINTLGNAPALGGDYVFYQVPATLYYTSGTTGWTNPWGGLPTVEMTGGDYQFSINPDGTSVTITGYTGPGGAINIPATLTGLPVTRIGESAFQENSSLTSVTIPEGVTSIGEQAFGWCNSLTSVTIPGSVTSFESAAFYSCSSLTSVTILPGVTTIEDWAFASCSSLTAIEVDAANNDFSSRDGILFNKAQTTLIQCPGGKEGTYTIPEGVTSIGNGAFVFCKSLTSVTIPEGVTSIGDSAFDSCGGLTSVTIPKSVTSIGEWAFSSCSSLTSLTILEGVTSIGSVAFGWCNSLTSVTIPGTVTSIGEWAFSDCNSLTAIEVDGTNNDFSSRDGILFNKAQTILIQYPGGKAGTYTIPSSVTSIGGGAFDSCNGLTSVTIPESVTSIGDYAFSDCYGLTRINSLGNAPALGDDDVFADVPATLYYTSGTTGWTNPWGGLPTVEMTGGDYQFSINPDSTSVTITGYTGPGGAVTIPDTVAGLPVTRIGGSAFQENSSLTSVTIPEGVTSIGERAFGWCNSLTSVTIPGSVTSFERAAFYSCSSLTSVTILPGVTTIEDLAFASCSSLTAIEVDAANNDFSSRDGILFNKAQTILIQYPGGKAGTYTIPSSVTSIGGAAFDSCNGLTSVTIPESVTSIGDYAFSSCSSLTRINTLGNAPALVGSDVFYQVPATLYYTSGTTGWTDPWAGLATVESSPVAAPFSLAAGSLVASLGDGKIGILSATGNYQEIYPFPGYEGPLNVNTVNSAAGQNADTIVVAVAGRSLPHVLTIDSSTGFVTSSFYAFDPGFLGGVTVAGGVTRIGGEITSVILCGAGSGSSPSVSVFNAVTRQPMGAFYAYSNQYLGGVRVALSEAGADGTSFAIIGSTINSHVVAFDLNDYYNPIMSFNAFHDNLTPQGIYVASGDLDGDNLNEIVVGAGQGNASPQVAVFGMDGKLKKSFNAFDMSFLGGVQVGVADFNKDGRLDILAASGLGEPGTLNIFNYDNLALIDSVFISDSTLGSDVASNFSRG